MASKPMAVLPTPCASCPYRRDCPPGVWAAGEYEKLRGYDEGEGELPALGTFLCHQTNATGRETLCRGWLSVHADSLAVRLGVLRGHIDPEAPWQPVAVPLYASGTEAADAGQAAVMRPPAAARRMVARLVRSRAGRMHEGKNR